MLVYYVVSRVSTHVEITACPISILQQPLTILDQEQIEAHMLSRCFERSRLVNFTSLLVNEGMDTPRLRFSLHHNLVILTTTLNGECIRIRVRVRLLEVVNQSITQHQSVLTNIQFDSVTSICLSTELSEGLRSGIGKGDHGLLR